MLFKDRPDLGLSFPVQVHYYEGLSSGIVSSSSVSHFCLSFHHTPLLKTSSLELSGCSLPKRCSVPSESPHSKPHSSGMKRTYFNRCIVISLTVLAIFALTNVSLPLGKYGGNYACVATESAHGSSQRRGLYLVHLRNYMWSMT